MWFLKRVYFEIVYNFQENCQNSAEKADTLFIPFTAGQDVRVQVLVGLCTHARAHTHTHTPHTLSHSTHNVLPRDLSACQQSLSSPFGLEAFVLHFPLASLCGYDFPRLSICRPVRRADSMARCSFPPPGARSRQGDVLYVVFVSLQPFSFSLSLVCGEVPVQPCILCGTLGQVWRGFGGYPVVAIPTTAPGLVIPREGCSGLG